MPTIEKIGRDGLEPADATPGIDRRKAFESDDVRVIRSRVTGETASGWHHHGDNHVYVYFVAGRARVEHGPDGEDVTEFGPGDFMHVPPRTIHRDVNPVDEEQVTILTVVGSDPWVVNVGGP